MRNGTVSSKWGDILMLSTVGSGHITPMLYVAKWLMERGLSITVVVTEDEPAVVAKKVDSKYLEAGGLMNLELVMSLSKLAVVDSGLKGISTNMERACEPLFQKLMAQRKSGTVRLPKCIVADQFLGWTQDWANELGIPRYVLFPSPAAYAVAMLCHESIENELDQALDIDDPDLIVHIPRLPLDLHTTDLPGSFLHNLSFRVQVVDRSGDSFREAAGILFNTFYELESAAIDSFQANIEKMNAPGKVTKMLPIGPMLPPAFFKEGGFTDEATQNSNCIQWLDSRPSSSVLYIAFGSWAFLTPHQIEELAHALEATQVPFLWILRVPDEKDVSEFLPPGFCERTQDHGYIYTGFAPQLQILSHPSTGGFLTHCGWNSSLESICRGVAMVGWPNKAEQGLCCRVLVDLAKVAIEVTKGPNELADRKDIERAITALMKEPQGQELKRRAAELQQLARAAVSPGGSSHRNLERFVEEIIGLPS